jgi:protein-disulfide isomerase
MSEKESSGSFNLFLYSGWIFASFLLGAWAGRLLPFAPVVATTPQATSPAHLSSTTLAPARVATPTASAPAARCAPTPPPAPKPLTAADIPGIAFDRLPEDKRKQALALLNSLTFPCSCGQTAAKCAQKDLNCPTIQRVIEYMMESISQGKPETDIKKGLATLGTAPSQASAPTPLSIPLGKAPQKGSPHAKLTIVLFSDFECPYCAQAQAQVDALAQKFGKENIRVVYRHLPLPFHPKARPAAIASLAAHRQGKFWEYHDKLFANQEKLSSEDLLRYANELKLDIERFKKDLADPALDQAVSEDVKLATQINVPGTPSFYINGYAIGEQESPLDVANYALKRAEEALKKGVKPEELYNTLIQNKP